MDTRKSTMKYIGKMYVFKMRENKQGKKERAK